ncbi:MAG TPA: AsmA family protein, partial [Gemmatimonadaceae bacterium]|nr:AsmA family protein [Gemmatimonadaceae bacterium]
MRTRRAFLGVTVAAAAVLVLALGAGLFLLYTPRGREYLRVLLVARLGDQITGRIAIGRVSGDLPNEVVLHDVTLVDSAGSPVFAVKRLGARVNVLQLFSKRIDISSMTLEQPRLVLRHRRGGAWNVARVFAREDRDATASGGRGFGHWVRIADARVSDGEVIVRMPWPADAEATRQPRDRDATIADRARARVERTHDGVEQVMEFRDIEATFPRVLLAHPDTARIIAEVGRASMIAAPFQPPVADVRDLGGTLVVTSDSLQFVGWRVIFPGSRMTVQLHYAPTTGALRGQLRADPLAFRDLQWLYPLLPGDGRGSVTITGVRDASGPLALRATDLVAEVGASTATGAVGFAIGDTVRLTDADVRIASLDTELADRLVPGRLPLHGTVDGRATVTSAGGGLATDAEITFRDRRGAMSHVAARGTVTVGDALGARALRVDLSPLDAGVVRAFFPRARVHGRLAGRAAITGTVRRGWRLSGDLTHLDRGARSRFIGTAMVVPGEGRAAIDGRALPLSLDAIARLAPEAGLRGSASGPLKAELAGDTLTLRTTLRVADGTLGGAGLLSWGADGVSYDVTLEARELDPNDVSTRAPRGRVSGTVVARGHGTDPRTSRATVAVALENTHVDRVSVDSIRLAARAA